MSLVRASMCLLQNTKKTVKLIPQVATGHWHRDWQPGPYPTTEEEKLAAAKKYNLLPIEYEPYDPSGGIGFGDYPRLPTVCHDDKDPNWAWTYGCHRANYGEALHVNMHVYTFERMTLNPDLYYTYSEAFYRWLFWSVAYTVLFFGLQTIRPFSSRMPKRYPKDGDSYYFPE